MLVAEDLDLDVARLEDGLLDVDERVAEGAAGLALGALERGAELVFLWTRRMPLPPPPKAALISTG